MELGFYHPDRGYWQAVGVADTEHLEELLLGYPEGTIQVPLKPGERYSWVDGQWVAHPAPTPEELRENFPTLNPAQIRLGLLSVGITEAMVEEKLAGNAAGLIEWRMRPSYRRLHPLVLQLATPEAFDLPPEQVDALWLWAADL